MSYRYSNAFIDPGLNTLVPPTPQTLYNLYGWGNSGFGQLGLGNTSYYSSPKQVGNLTNWLKVAGGNYFTLATKTDGTLWSWGYNSNGQLGLGNRTNYSSPKQIGALTNWLSVACANYASFAIKTDGTLWSWGQNHVGQLGLNTTTAYSSPVQVGSLTNWSSIFSNYSSSVIAIKTDGTMWSWGNNAYGTLGLGNTSPYSSPKQVGALTTWKVIGGGNYNALAVKSDGSLWCVGGVNAFGQSGLGNTTYYSSPKQIGALTNWAKVTGGAQFSLATKTDGTLWSWGRNYQGYLGLGNTTNYSSPKQVGALTNWGNVSGIYSSVCAIKTDGTLWAWGYGGAGALGLGNTTSYSSPKQVGTSTTWSFVAYQAASNSVLALG